MDKKWIEFIKKVIQKYVDPLDQKVFIFGSRATGENMRFSDIDIGFEGTFLNTITKFSIEEELEESDLPYLVDLVDFNTVSEKFKKVAKRKVIPLNY